MGSGPLLISNTPMSPMDWARLSSKAPWVRDQLVTWGMITQLVTLTPEFFLPGIQGGLCPVDGLLQDLDELVIGAVLRPAVNEVFQLPHTIMVVHVFLLILHQYLLQDHSGVGLNLLTPVVVEVVRLPVLGGG